MSFIMTLFCSDERVKPRNSSVSSQNKFKKLLKFDFKFKSVFNDEQARPRRAEPRQASARSIVVDNIIQRRWPFHWECFWFWEWSWVVFIIFLNYDKNSIDSPTKKRDLIELWQAQRIRKIMNKFQLCIK